MLPQGDPIDAQGIGWGTLGAPGERVTTARDGCAHAGTGSAWRPGYPRKGAPFVGVRAFKFRRSSGAHYGSIGITADHSTLGGALSKSAPEVAEAISRGME
jgi:hypothetical protein